METLNNKASILIVDDEADIREILQFNLEYEGFSVDLASSAEEAISKLNTGHQLILLDVMMESMSGYKMADMLRKEGNKIPIIFLTAKNTENDMLTGFSIGGDDYITKPFSIKEVVARIKSVLKRSQQSTRDEIRSVFEIEDLAVDIDFKTVKIKGEIIDLTKTEFNILVLLMENEGKTYTRSDILSKAWEGNGIVLNRTVDVHITRLRKKIGIYGEYIINRTGYGYSFNSRHK